MNFDSRVTPEDYPVVCIDLDGTIIGGGVYPSWGKPFPDVVETINKMVEEGYEIVIWTSRDNETRKEVIKELEEDYGLVEGIRVNKHSDYCLAMYAESSPKVFGHIYLDDLAWGAPDFSTSWGKLQKVFCGNKRLDKYA